MSLFGDITLYEDDYNFVSIPDSLYKEFNLRKRKIENHSKNIYNIRTFCINGLDILDSNKITRKKHHLNIDVQRNGNTIRYFNNVENYHFDKNDIVSFFFYDRSLDCYTKIDSTKRIPILKKQAEKFLRNFLKYYGMGDSFEEFELGDLIEYDDKIEIHYKSTYKGDIVDVRDVRIELLREYGIITRYIGEIKNKYSLEYVPKINKSNAMELINLEINKNILSYKITRIKLKKLGERWIWYAFLSNLESKQTLASIIYIDSETGEILRNDLAK